MSKFILSQIDLSKRYLGNICKNNHNHGQIVTNSWRYKKGGGCVECVYDNRLKWNILNASKRVDYQKEYQKTVEYKLCCERYRLTNNCILARKLHSKTDKFKLSQKRYHQSDKGKLTAKTNNHLRRARKIQAETEKVDLQLIYEYFNNECCYCGSKDILELEHIKPLARGGSHKQNNLAIACISCNRSKNVQSLFEWYNNSKPFYTLERFVKIAQWTVMTK